MKKRKILLVINPCAGRLKGKRSITGIIKIFKRYNYKVTTHFTAYRGDATRIIEENAEHFDMIVCSGGDGTLNEVISGIKRIGLNIPLGYIPSGSTNDFAASLGLSRDIRRATENIAKGTERQIDIGDFNGRKFAYVAAFGAFSESSYSAPQQTKNAIGHLAYILQGVKDLKNIRPIHIKMVIGDDTYEDDYIMGSISNTTSIGGILKLDPKKVSLDDGLFEVMLVKTPKNATDLSNTIRDLLIQNFSGERILMVHTDRVTIMSEDKIPWSLDGEYEPGSTEITITNEHNAITIVS